MYTYRPIDQRIVDERVAEFRDQTQRFLDGKLSEDEFRQLRLRNGVYIQRHAPMIRVAIPYGLLSSTQLRTLAHIARTYDKDYGHFTTRQNIQYNWPTIESIPDILADLAKVQMHAFQTSGNCIRNTTVDHFAGLSRSEVADPRPYAELLRQWSTAHPEFLYLPRKFKVAFTGDTDDHSAMRFHDIGLRLKHDDSGNDVFEVYVGGGLGRTPVVAPLVRDNLPAEDMLTYCEAILRVYNLGGDRKNKYKARIKIQVRQMGVEAFRAAVDEEFARIQKGPLHLTQEHIDVMKASWKAPAFATLDDEELVNVDASDAELGFRRRNLTLHKQPGYVAVTLNLKDTQRAPGDATSAEMDAIADLADKFSMGEVRVTHEQNLVLPHVEQRTVSALFAALVELGLAESNAGTVEDLICCPGLDFCNLANTHSIPLSKTIIERMQSEEKREAIGPLKLKMSGCINACGHHHVGHIGILGVDKKGVEGYQILVGGEAGEDASIGRWIGPALDADSAVDAIEAITDHYVAEREDGETFLQFTKRVGHRAFHDVVYKKDDDAETQGGAA